MEKVIACIDGLTNSTAACDAAAWAARRLDAPLELLHVLEPRPSPGRPTDLSGAIGVDTQDLLLQELSQLDEQRARLAQEHGRQLLEAARQRMHDAGVGNVETRQRHGELVEAVHDLEGGARLFVLGQHEHAHDHRRLHLDHHVERVIRTVKRPVLVASGRTFAAPRRIAIAFDGSDTGRRMIARIAASPLFVGIPCTVMTAGDDAQAARDHCAWARDMLAEAGFDASAEHLDGAVEPAIEARLGDGGGDLLVMGAYGHSRIRHLIVGSTTTTLLRTSPVPVLILR